MSHALDGMKQVIPAISSVKVRLTILYQELCREDSHNSWRVRLDDDGVVVLHKFTEYY